YNKIAKLYGIQQYDIAENEFIVLCDFEGVKSLRDIALKNAVININGKMYHSRYDKCQSGFIFMSTSHTNTGLILVPDSFNLKEEWKESHLLVANYQANSEEEYEEIEKLFSSSNSGFIQNLSKNGIKIDGQTKQSIIQSSVGVATIVVFIAIYLGIIFLIASSAILALKQLTESSDNKQRYTILRKIGCDEKMINSALLKQIGIFFILPLVLAIIHSIFGIQFVLKLLSTFADAKDLIPSIIATIVVMGGIYGAYFMATYIGSKSIIKEER
ncbi:MAG: ABC transporter permease, partial [Clostridia bacterium]|nr:ABC transporter permease [Clostridia bacterium]